jgi:hypothetical protein
MAAAGHLRPGSYLGDVSALSFLPSSPRPLLLAGTLFPYDCPRGLWSVRVCMMSRRRVTLNIHALRLVAAGTGSELLVYEVGAARLLAAFQVFDGVRVHGIELRVGRPHCSTHSLAVFGERRVKLFSLGLRVSADGSEVSELLLELEQRLPGFDHWVLDARFLEVPRLVLALTVELFNFTTMAAAVPGAGRQTACDRSE